MDVKHRQRAVVEFLTNEGYTNANIHRRIRNVYAEVALDKYNVLRWVNKFKTEEISTDDKPPRSHRTKT